MSERVVKIPGGLYDEFWMMEVDTHNPAQASEGRKAFVAAMENAVKKGRSMALALSPEALSYTLSSYGPIENGIDIWDDQASSTYDKAERAKLRRFIRQAKALRTKLRQQTEAAGDMPSGVLLTEGLKPGLHRVKNKTMWWRAHGPFPIGKDVPPFQVAPRLKLPDDAESYARAEWPAWVRKVKAVEQGFENVRLRLQPNAPSRDGAVMICPSPRGFCLGDDASYRNSRYYEVKVTGTVFVTDAEMYTEAMVNVGRKARMRDVTDADLVKEAESWAVPYWKGGRSWGGFDEALLDPKSGRATVVRELSPEDIKALRAPKRQARVKKAKDKASMKSWLASVGKGESVSEGCQASDVLAELTERAAADGLTGDMPGCQSGRQVAGGMVAAAGRLSERNVVADPSPRPQAVLVEGTLDAGPVTSLGAVTFHYWDGQDAGKVPPPEMLRGFVADVVKLWRRAAALVSKLPGGRALTTKPRRVVLVRRVKQVHRSGHAAGGYVTPDMGGMKLAPGVTQPGDVLVGYAGTVTSLETLVHELGHAYWYEVVGKPAALEFIDASYAASDDPWAFASPYGRSNPEEDFAETFAAYLTGGLSSARSAAKPRFLQAVGLSEAKLDEGMKTVRNLPDGMGVGIVNIGSNELVIYYVVAEHGVVKSAGHQGSASVWGRVQINAPKPSTGPCDGAWSVNWAKAANGWGPLLYDVAIEVATLIANGLTPDRISVSPHAHRVWTTYYKNRADVTSHQLDVKGNTDTWTKLTPKDPGDDCLQVSATDWYKSRDQWHKVPEAFRYTKTPYTLKQLVKAGRLHVEDAARSMIPRFGSASMLSEGVVAERSYGPEDVPKHFYISTSFHSKHVDLLGELLRGKPPVLDGVRGVSATPDIDYQLGHMPDVLIEMPARDLLKLNKLSRAMYSNPHYLAQDDMRALKRIVWGSARSNSFNMQMHLMRNVGVSSKLLIGDSRSQKRDALVGAYHSMWRRDPSIKDLHELAQRWKKAYEAMIPRYDETWPELRSGVGLSHQEWVEVLGRAVTLTAAGLTGEAEWIVKSGRLALPKSTVLWVADMYDNADWVESLKTERPDFWTDENVKLVPQHKLRGMVRYRNESLGEALLDEAMKTVKDLPDHIGVKIRRHGQELQIYYFDLEAQTSPVTGGKDPWGHVHIRPVANDLFGPCDGAYRVKHSRAKHGWGPLLYDVAIELATKAGESLMPDRVGVSDFAHKVWMKYLKNRPDVKAHQLDIEEPNEDDFPQLTPDDYDDDCQQEMAVLYGDDEWYKQPEAFRYTKPPTTLDALKKADKLVRARVNQQAFRRRQQQRRARRAQSR